MIKRAFLNCFRKSLDRSRPASNRRVLRSTSRRSFDLANSLHLIHVEDGDNAVTAISRTRCARDQPGDFVTALFRANYFSFSAAGK